VLLTLTVFFLVFSTSCASGGYQNSPTGVTTKLFDSLQENDADKYLDSITPSDRQQPGFFFYRQLIQGIMGSVGLGQMEGAKLRISFSGLKYQEIDNDGQTAHVAVNGKLRDLNFAIEQDFFTTIRTDKIASTWLCNISGGEQSVSSQPTITPSQNGLLLSEPYAEWQLIPINIIIDVPSSSREGYRKVTFYFILVNVGVDLQLITPGTPNITIEVVDSQNYTYTLNYAQQGEPHRSAVPPNFYVSWYAAGEIPNNAVGISLQIKSASKSVILNLNELQDNSILSMNFTMNYSPEINTYSKLTGISASIGSTETAPNIAEVTLISATYDSTQGTWNLSLNIKNLYGYDLAGIGFELYSSLFTFAPTNYQNIYIVPGQQKTINLSFYTGNDVRSHDFVIVTLFQRDQRDPSYKTSQPFTYYSSFTAHKFP
jgi:hypothetical protein